MRFFKVIFFLCVAIFAIGLSFATLFKIQSQSTAIATFYRAIINKAIFLQLDWDTPKRRGVRDCRSADQVTAENAPVSGLSESFAGDVCYPALVIVPFQFKNFWGAYDVEIISYVQLIGYGELISSPPRHLVLKEYPLGNVSFAYNAALSFKKVTVSEQFERELWIYKALVENQ